MTPLTQALFFAAASLASALAGLIILSLSDRRVRRAMPPRALLATDPTVFLFEEGELIDATLPARQLLGRIGGADRDWDRLLRFLGGQFPAVERAVAALGAEDALFLTAEGNPDYRLRAERSGASIRLMIEDLAHEGQAVVQDSLSVRAQEDEISALREIVGSLPLPVWRTDPDGNIRWANDSYVALAAARGDVERPSWPLPSVFGQGGQEPGGAHRRVSLQKPVAPFGQWYDCRTADLSSGKLHMAMPADQLVKTEATLKEFIQTLSKTFAHLSVGLAIFDRNRRLALFNPALTDLSSLGVEFLSARPTLHSFLDRLREARVLPEPKDYASWRKMMGDLESAAAAGTYEETWALPSGQTYRITGRPHPEGAVAFLFEDITAEMSLTRRFRAEIELGQSVIDAMDEAICVFAHTGELMLSNSRFAELWDLDPATTLGTVGIVDAIRHWQTVCRPSPFWGELRDFVLHPADRTDWEGDIITAAGQPFVARVSPLAGGSTIVRFRTQPGDRPHVHRSRRARHGSPGEPQAGYMI